ncbi:MAG: nitrate reductase [Candidatus Zixiibacteriota bacterium]
MMWIQFVTYASVLIAVVAMLAKAFRYIKAPQNFRWELYPVPHEKGKAEYGGSYLEELDWWTKPRHSDMIRELKEMMEEIFFLKGVFRNNKRVWVSSLPFHLGLYLCIGWLLLLLLGSLLEIFGVAIGLEAGVAGVMVHYLTVFTGYAGLILTGLGAFGLFIWRLTDANQKAYNSFADYFNLLFFDAVIAVALLAHIQADPDFTVLRGYVHSLVTFSAPTWNSGWLTAEILMVSLLILYIPLTRMSHFVAKYFLYHSVRWSDEPNFKGGKIEQRLMTLLQQKVSWSAPHIQQGKPWTEVVKEMKHE